MMLVPIGLGVVFLLTKSSWSDLPYHPTDGRVIFRGFATRVLRDSLPAEFFSEKAVDHVTQMILCNEATWPGAPRVALTIGLIHYTKPFRKARQLAKRESVSVEVRFFNLSEKGNGGYMSATWEEGGFPWSQDLNGYGFGYDDISVKRWSTGKELADRLLPLETNHRLKINEDFYLLQVYDQVRVYRVSEAPAKLKQVLALHNGKLGSLFRLEAGSGYASAN